MPFQQFTSSPEDSPRTVGTVSQFSSHQGGSGRVRKADGAGGEAVAVGLKTLNSVNPDGTNRQKNETTTGGTERTDAEAGPGRLPGTGPEAGPGTVAEAGPGPEAGPEARKATVAGTGVGAETESGTVAGTIGGAEEGPGPVAGTGPEEGRGPESGTGRRGEAGPGTVAGPGRTVWGCKACNQTDSLTDILKAGDVLSEEGGHLTAIQDGQKHAPGTGLVPVPGPGPRQGSVAGSSAGTETGTGTTESSGTESKSTDKTDVAIPVRRRLQKQSKAPAEDSPFAALDPSLSTSFTLPSTTTSSSLTPSRTGSSTPSSLGSGTVSSLLATSSSSTTAPSELDEALASPALQARCNGIMAEYFVNSFKESSRPGLYVFEVLFLVRNGGTRVLKDWSVTFGYVHNEFITNVTNLRLPRDTSLPVAGLGLQLHSPVYRPNLEPLTSAFDRTKEFSGHLANIEGTELGVPSRRIPHFPSMINLTAADGGVSCDPSDLEQPAPYMVRICCRQRPPQVLVAPQPEADGSSPREQNYSLYSGILIRWDVVRSRLTDYDVRIRIENQQKYVVIPSEPGWRLSFAWEQGEFLWSCDDCETTLRADCTRTPAASDFKNLTGAYSCDPRPVFLDKTKKNGSLAAPALDAKNSIAEIGFKAGKPRAYWDVNALTLPSDFAIGLQGYDCSTPQRIAEPTLFPAFNWSRQAVQAIATWTISCGPRPEVLARKRCCTSISAFYSQRKDASPCTTCVCGCAASEQNSQCIVGTPARPTPASLLLLGAKQKEEEEEEEEVRVGRQANVQDLKSTGGGRGKGAVMVPGRCGSGCGVTVHLHIQQADENGWTLQVAIANAREVRIPDWYLVLEYAPGVASMLSFADTVNWTSTESNKDLVFLGFELFNDVILEQNLTEPGNVQWRAYFNKTARPSSSSSSSSSAASAAASVGLTVLDSRSGLYTVLPGAFPKSVLFMGEECVMPEAFPRMSAAAPSRSSPLFFFKFVTSAFFEIRLRILSAWSWLTSTMNRRIVMDH
ncbi:hypothetical protein CBR_g22012 [Chara braunii]|uniref:COBRA C-terminal domain-containing protein n=1 Tax=Chara braunii TaxID=69332 RepID=A0A388L1R9_CHABU|nr:hypothetical protein CBR_g22012 [Chara braunii]|eukprot:GBG76264.1 hypothetical protein CBR_g22012 [Chara braunii]